MTADPLAKLIARFPEAERPAMQARIDCARSLGWRRFRLFTDAVHGPREAPAAANVWAEDGNGRLRMLSEIEPAEPDAGD